MATHTVVKKEAVRTESAVSTRIATGAAAGAMIASGIGTLVIGMMTTGAVLSSGLKSFLNMYNPAGPLSGKTTVGVIVWLISWFVLNRIWKDEDYDLAKAFTITLILIGLGLILTFPPVFEAFE